MLTGGAADPTHPAHAYSVAVVITASFDARDLNAQWTESVERLASSEVITRLWAKDHTVVSSDPTEVANRMGWVHVIEESIDNWPKWVLEADRSVEAPAGVAGARVDQVLVLGMGGSSLFPEVLCQTFQPGTDFPSLTILDSTDPAAVARVSEECHPDRTMIVASSKSGTTVETRSHLAHFWERHPFGRDFAVVTDPGSALEAFARDNEFREIVHGVPEIGGRFSALSAFGMFPAALMGLDGPALLETAAEAHELLGPRAGDEQDNIAVQLGALMAVAAQAGRDKLTIIVEDSLSSFGSWLEQLIAESTGKHGKGIMPVVGEDVASPDPEHRLYAVIGSAAFVARHRDSHDSIPGPYVELLIDEPEELGAQVFLWEVATTIAGIVLGINPFDQPDVESAKAAARNLLAEPAGSVPVSTIDQALGLLREGDTLVIGAFVDPVMENDLQKARKVLSSRVGVPTTLGIGPRFLHSTGQLHKGGPDRLVMLQVVGGQGSDDDTVDIPVPGEDFTFGRLRSAQADGDLVALAAAGKRHARVDLHELLDLAD